MQRNDPLDGYDVGKRTKDYDLYTIVHRGTYHSELLSCLKAQAENSPSGGEIAVGEVAGCVEELREQWGDKLKSFRLSHAARDLSHAIRRTRKPGQDVFLYGISYGTLLAQRFAQIAPLQATGILLDGALPPRNISYFDYDLQFDDVAERIAALCKEDSFCSSKWPNDPWKALLKLRDRIDDGHCESLDMSPTQLKTLTAQLLAGASTREDVLALLYRIQRCDARDVAVVKHYFATLQAEQAKGMEDYDPRNFSMPLFYNIVFSEVMGGGDIDLPSVEQIESRCESSPFCPGYSVNARKVYDHWPAYEPDRFYAKFAKFRTPVLAMSGSLDPQTPIDKARSIAKSCEGSSQRFVELPYSPHIVLLNSEVKSDNELNCAGQMVASFLNAPDKAVDDSCLQDLLGLNFEADEEHARKYFDSDDAWENEGAMQGMSLRSIELDWDKVIRVMARANRRI